MLVFVAPHGDDRVHRGVAENASQQRGFVQCVDDRRLVGWQQSDPCGCALVIGQGGGVDGGLGRDGEFALDAVERQPKNRRGREVGVRRRVDDLHLDVRAVRVAWPRGEEADGRLAILGAPAHPGARPAAWLHP